MNTYFRDVIEAICKKDSYTAGEFTGIEAEAVLGVQQVYEPVIKELCDSYRAFTDALNKLEMIDSDVEQVQSVLNDHAPADYKNGGQVPRFNASVIQDSLNESNVDNYMNTIMKGV